MRATTGQPGSFSAWPSSACSIRVFSARCYPYPSLRPTGPMLCRLFGIGDPVIFIRGPFLGCPRLFPVDPCSLPRVLYLFIIGSTLSCIHTCDPYVSSPHTWCFRTCICSSRPEQQGSPFRRTATYPGRTVRLSKDRPPLPKNCPRIPKDRPPLPKNCPRLSENLPGFRRTVPASERP